MLFNTVNQHCLKNIVQLAETHTVEAAEDIFDERGIKLWAKGKPVSADLQEKLLRRKLAKPLEATLTVEGAVGFPDIVEACRAQIDQNPLFARLVNRDALGLLNGMKAIKLPPPLRLLLTTAHVNGNRSFKHSLATIVIAAGIAARLNASEHDAQILLTAALLHDLGEMYIDPDYLNCSYTLQPNEWKHVASHPRIGELLIHELTTLPAAVGLCVAQHHERRDGSGYPNQTDATKHNRLGDWLAVADSVGAILSRGDCGAPLRAMLALRIVPEEFDRDAVAVVTQALRKSDDSFGQQADCSCVGDAQMTWKRLCGAIEVAERLYGSCDTPFVRQTVGAALQLLHNLNKSLRATGVVEAGSLGELDAELIAEICQIVKEVDWRMRNLARNLYLRAETHAEGRGVTMLAPLIAALDAVTETATA